MTEINLNATPKEIQKEVEDEIKRAGTIHPPYFSSTMEALGVITEEYFEVVEAFRLSKDKYPEGNIQLRRELVQLAAMCHKAVQSVCVYRK